MPNNQHPRVEPSPVCTDRLTISRSRVQRLIAKADAAFWTAAILDKNLDADYAAGIRDALAYLLDPDSATLSLSRTLEV